MSESKCEVQLIKGLEEILSREGLSSIPLEKGKHGTLPEFPVYLRRNLFNMKELQF